MKFLLTLALPLTLAPAFAADTSTGLRPSGETLPASAPAKLGSHVYDWEKMAATPTATGVRRTVFDAPTTTVEKLHCHITTLNPGQTSGAPRLHPQEEFIVVKEGTLEANFDGKAESGGAGSVIFLAAGATTFLRNAGNTPVTYIVLNYQPPASVKR